MIHSICFIAILLIPNFNRCAASEKDSIIAEKIKLFKQQRSIEKDDVEWINLSVTNSTTKLLTLTFRAQVGGASSLIVSHGLKSNQKYSLQIPTEWQTVDITETGTKKIILVAGMPLSIAWIHHGTYQKKDIIDEPEIKEDALGKIVLIQVKELIEETAENA